MSTAWEELPLWMRPPRESGWEADDLDHVPDLPRHTELIDGALVFRMSPRRSAHARIVENLTFALRRAAGAAYEVEREMTVRIDKLTRPEPDILAATVPYDPDRTRFLPEEVALIVEVVSPESAHRDRTVKPMKYAEAGIPHYWRVEEESGLPVAHVYELDETTRWYVATGIHRDRLKVAVPFPVDLDLAALAP
ncbi:Uma2 family endonuclease [Streptomyces sp. G45]|uniref:Uma2 family endonuclease n=1 Tax=Streptomyces sp. G45 TaxID=3406627 RepID=UPI003C235692